MAPALHTTMARRHDLRDGVALITGAASGIGAALAANRGIEPRAVDLDELQAALAGQGVYLRPRARKVAASA